MKVRVSELELARWTEVARESFAGNLSEMVRSRVLDSVGQRMTVMATHDLARPVTEAQLVAALDDIAAEAVCPHGRRESQWCPVCNR